MFRNLGSMFPAASLTLEDAYNLLIQLHETCRLRDRWNGGHDIPFDQLYRLEYQLRILDARLWASDICNLDDGIGRIFTATAQLQTFVSTHAWLPVRSETLRMLLRRSGRLLHLHRESIARSSMGSHMSFWLWASFTVLALGLEIGEDINFAGIVKMLRDMLESSDIGRSAFVHILCEWPLCVNWCEEKVFSLEELLFGGGSCVPIGFDADAILIGPRRSSRAAYRNHYVGVIEFYVRP